jgi:hypothetical protein
MTRSILVGAALAIAALARTPAWGAPLERLEYENDRITLRAMDVPIADIVDSLKRQSGADVRGTAPDRSVSGVFDAVPLRLALERLLGEQSFTLRYGEDGRLKTIELKGGPVAGKPKKEEKPIAGPNLGAHDGKTPPHIVRVLDALSGPVPLTGRLRDMAGTDKGGWDFVLSISSQHQDPTLRADAIRTAVHAIEQDAEMRDAMLAAFRDMDDTQLEEFVRMMARSVDDDPDEFVKEIVRYSHIGEVRSRAHGLVRQIRIADRAAGSA